MIQWVTFPPQKKYVPIRRDGEGKGLALGGGVVPVHRGSAKTMENPVDAIPQTRAVLESHW